VTVANLAGRHAFITGGSGGIGAATARQFLIDGGSVSLVARRMSALQRVAEALYNELGRDVRIQLLAADALDAVEVSQALQASHAFAERLDICVATVGGGAIKPLLMHDEDSFMDEIKLNLQGTFLVLKYATPLMREHGGSIVCVSSDAAKLVFPWLPAYTTAKAGLEGLVRSAAEELSPFKIRVNAVRPGLTRTEATQALFDDPDIYQRFAAEKPLGRLGEPSDIAQGIRYLAGPESSWVTGQSFAIEGGNELRKAADMSAMVEQIYGAEAFASVKRGDLPFG
jgi:NAD(P)-dependent dehydrogenase (short-subunit alcohol dehydrogenase family)|tara:strand:+ start:1171 stop:2022 length:852 start_codon:yes stop_codon:yes gene_type:complete